MSLSIKQVMAAAQRNGYTLRDVMRVYAQCNEDIAISEALMLVEQFVSADYEHMRRRVATGLDTVYAHPTTREVLYEAKAGEPYVAVTLVYRPDGSELRPSVSHVDVVGTFLPRPGIRQAVCSAFRHSPREVINTMLDITIHTVLADATNELHQPEN